MRDDDPTLYLVDPSTPDGGSPAYTIRTPQQLGLGEAWYRDSIAANPELALKPCRDAGLTDEAWKTWATEVGTGAGRIDVLLVSESGRFCIVETKLATNPEARRKVVAQVLDYALALPDMAFEDLPDPPRGDDGNWFCDPDDARARLSEGDYLLVIVADENSSQAVRLADAMLGEHITSGWNLAFVDLVLLEGEPGRVLALPQLRRTLVYDTRQVVIVRVEGETPRASVEVDRLNPAQRRSGPLADLVRKTQRLRSGVAWPPAP
jgi:hypothetical protein